MRHSRSMILALSLLVAPAGLLLGSEVAVAQSGPAVFAEGGLVDIIPPGDVIADGRSTYTGHVFALDTAGRPASGLKIKIGSSIGKISDLNETQPGVYTFTWTPPPVTAPVEAVIDIKTRTADRVTITREAKVRARPHTASGMQVTSNPPQLILGQDASGTLSFTLADAAGKLAVSDLAVRASVGEIENLTQLGPGQFTARYVTPKVNFPQLAIVSVVDLRNPDTVYAVLPIPLQGKVDYPVQGAAGSAIIMRIAGREFGPVPVDTSGKAKVPIIVPAGVQNATKVEVKDGQTNEEVIDLRVPETPRLSLLPTMPGVHADGNSTTPVRVAVFTPEGAPDPGAKVTLAATGGSVGPVRAVGNGIFEADFKPAFSNVPATGKITATLAGSSVQSATLDVTLLPARPSRIALRTQPEQLGADTAALRLFAKVEGPQGQGLDRRDLALTVSGASVKGSVEDLRNGDYRADFNTKPGANVEVVGSLRVPETGNPLGNVLLLPSTPHVVNDGASVRRITVVSVDQAGYPVPGVEVKLNVEQGDGNVQPAVTTDEAGVAQVAYTAGRGVGLVRIRAQSGNRTSVTHLIQGPEGVASTVLPLSGDDRIVGLLSSWAQVVTPLRILREGATVADSAEVETSASSSGELARLRATSEPATVPAGGSAVLTVQASDASGAGVTGVPLELIVSSGQAGPVTELGGGKYQVTVSVPADAVGEVKVSVASGDTASFIKIPVGPATTGTSAWGSTDGAATAAAPIEGAPTGTQTGAVQPPKSSGEIDLTRIRVRGSYLTSGYSYQQRPFANHGPLLPATVAVGGEDGGSAAAPQGFELAGRGFFHDYVGFDANFRMTSWSLTAPEFNNQKVPDVLFHLNADVIGRYPFEVGDNHFWVGGRVGYHGSDMLFFTGNIDEGRVSYQSMFFQGLGFGAELGAEVGDIYMHGALSGRLVGVSRWFATAVDAHVGYQITDQIFVDLGFGLVDRQATLRGERSGEIGELNDRQLMGRIGGGFRF